MLASEAFPIRLDNIFDERKDVRENKGGETYQQDHVAN